MQSASDIINKMGGATAVAKILKLPMTTVASWKTRNCIPVERWRELVDMARFRGLRDVTYERLVELHTDRQAAE